MAIAMPTDYMDDDNSYYFICTSYKLKSLGTTYIMMIVRCMMFARLLHA